MAIGVLIYAFKRPQGLSSSKNTPGIVSADPPIILVHGFNQTSNFWDDISLIKDLKEKNYILMGEYYANETQQIQLRDTAEITASQSACYKLALPAKGSKDIRDSAILLEKAIAEITHRHDTDKVKLITFSAGGIVCRQYLTNNINNHKTLSLTTVSAPHLGSEHAWLADGFHTIKSLLGSMESNTSGNALVRGSRHYSAKGIKAVTSQIEKWGLNAGIDINSKCARMLARPESGNYLDELSSAPHPSDLRYHCIITEENIFNYDVSSLKSDFAKLKKGNLSQMDLATTILDLGRFGLGKLDKISEQFSSQKFRGDGVVSRFSQDLNNIASFKNDTKLTASTTHLETQHGGPEICTAIIQALNFSAETSQ